MTSLITLKGVRKLYGTTPVLKGIDASVREGERVVIIGPSGSGKSTLIRCLNGLETFQGGEIVIEGISLQEDVRILSQVRARVGMVFQQFNLFPHLTVLENCTLAPQKVRGFSPERAVDMAKDYLSRVHLQDHFHKYPSQLSGGQQQRVAIARALCMEPRIMLFDEPTSALDPEMVHEVLEVMTDLAKGGMTMLCVTHEMGFAREMADSLWVMESGQLIEQGPPEQIFDNPVHARTAEFLSRLHR